MECTSISGLRLDQASKEGLQRIHRIHNLSNVLATTMAAGTLTNIFAGNGAGESIYNISTNDWQTFAKAVRAIPDIAQNRIRQEASLQVLEHGNDIKQERFWKAIYDGCTLH